MVPADLKIPGTGYLTTSDQFLELNELPRRIVFIGGGYIAFEFAHVAARAGSQVTVLHRGPRPLALFDPDLVDQLVERTRELGIDVHLGTEAIGIEKSFAQLIVRAVASGETGTFQAEMVVHAAGRVPEINDLNLDVAGIEWDKRGVRVNEFLQSVSIPSVYAAGDAAASGGPPLAPVASYEGQIVATNLLNGNRETPNYLGIPSVVFTIPQLAAVGLSESEASEQNPAPKTNVLLGTLAIPSWASLQFATGNRAPRLAPFARQRAHQGGPKTPHSPRTTVLRPEVIPRRLSGPAVRGGMFQDNSSSVVVAQGWSFLILTSVTKSEKCRAQYRNGRDTRFHATVRKMYPRQFWS